MLGTRVHCLGLDLPTSIEVLLLAVWWILYVIVSPWLVFSGSFERFCWRITRLLHSCLHPARYRVRTVPHDYVSSPSITTAATWAQEYSYQLQKRGSCAYYGVQDDGRIKFARCASSAIYLFRIGFVSTGLGASAPMICVFASCACGRLPGGYCCFCFIIFIGTGVRLMDGRGAVGSIVGLLAAHWVGRHEDRHVDR